MRQYPLANFSPFRRALAVWTACLLGLSNQGSFAAPLTVPVSTREAVSGYSLLINLTPGMCFLNPSMRSLRQCQEGFALTVASLKPEFLSGHSLGNCTQSTAQLSPVQLRIVERIMPDDGLRNLDWQQSGACTGMTANNYFRTIAKLADQLRLPPQINASRQLVMRYTELFNSITELNPTLPKNGLQLHCASGAESGHQAILVQMRVCYNPNGMYRSCPSSVYANCPSRFLIEVTP